MLQQITRQWCGGWSTGSGIRMSCLKCGGSFIAPNAQYDLVHCCVHSCDTALTPHVPRTCPAHAPHMSGSVLQIPGDLLFLRRVMAVTNSSKVTCGNGAANCGGWEGSAGTLRAMGLPDASSIAACLSTQQCAHHVTATAYRYLCPGGSFRCAAWACRADHGTCELSGCHLCADCVALG